jgi:serine protease Do
MRYRAIRGALFLLTAFVLGGLILPNLHVSWREPDSAAQQGGGLGVSPAPTPSAVSPAEVYARAAQAVYKSVVNIDTTERVRVRGFWFDDEDMFGGPRYRERSSEGSGVIISRDGYILTNEHVVGAANQSGKQVAVTMTDGRKLQANIVGADRTADVALLKVDAKDLPAAKMGTVAGLVPGQMVVALGNPLGLRFTVTNGVVSALGRPLTMPDGRIYSDLIQHDALINPGNSGGALANLEGQVIGINTLVNANAQGIGFAIPINTALRVADELKRYGKVKRPWLGIVVDTNGPQYVERFDVPNVPGAVVTGVYRDGPAAQAGVQGGDVVTSIGGRAVKTVEDYRAVEKGLRIGSQVEILLRRGDQQARGTITVGEAP